jgi:carbamoyl-phosphate synthase large subunit
MINVLLTCAGRRNYLVGYFREALAGRGEILAADLSASAPAMHEADRAFLVPPITDPDYIETLLRICRENQVRLVLSLNDLELPILARHRHRFEAVGATAVVSSADVIDLCFDKLQTARFVEEIGLSTPRTFATLEEARQAVSRGELTFPTVIKPRWGTASIGNDYPASMEELEMGWHLGRLRLLRSFLAGVSSADEERCFLIQEKLPGVEYNLDIVNDLQGRHVKTFVRRKIAMRVGEGAVQAVTVDDPVLEEIGRRISEGLGHVGILDCDIFVEGEKYTVIDLNPRFGGSYPFTHMAGADIPAVLIAWALGEPVDPAWLRAAPGVASAKCDRVVRIDEEKFSVARKPVEFTPRLAEAAQG